MNKPFYAKIMDKRTEEQIAGWNVSHINGAIEELNRIFTKPEFYYIVLLKKEEGTA
jgi:hypothetical protein